MKRFFWVDLEMTGLDDEKDQIIEVAIIIIDVDFKPLEELHRVVFQPQSSLDRMDDWCKKTHGESGLTTAVASGVPLLTVEKEILQLIERHYGPQDRIVLAGNSVGNDKRFIDRYMPLVAKRLHYRLIDISSFKEIFKNKYNVTFEKRNSHRALDDILESIRELQHYLAFVKVPLKQELKEPSTTE